MKCEVTLLCFFLQITLPDLHASINLPSSAWCDQSPRDEPLTCIKLCKLASQSSSSQQPLVVTHCLTVNDTLHWSLFVHNHEIKHDQCTALAPVPERLKPDTLALLLSLADRLGCVWASQMITSLPWLLLERELSYHMTEALLRLWISMLQYF